MTDTSPPAFPHPVDYFPGMTLRDWFAGQAISAIGQDLSNMEQPECIASYAKAAYDIADAMLAERAKP